MISSLIQVVHDFRDETLIFSVAAIFLGFYLTVKAVSLVIRFIRGA